MTDFSIYGTLLTREEAKKIRGGSTSMDCTNGYDCPEGYRCTGEGFCIIAGDIICTLTWSDGTTETSRCRAATLEECNAACAVGFPLGEPKCSCVQS